MALGTACGRVEPKDHLKQSHRVHPVLSGPRREGRPPHGLRIRVTQGAGLRRGHQPGAREDSLDQLDEARLVTLMHSARYQQSLRRYQARKVRR
jgi:hypothetical protein